MSVRLVGLSFAAAACLTGCGQRSSVTGPVADSASCLSVDSKTIAIEAENWVVVGTAHNQCDRPVRMARVVFKLSNSAGAVIGNVSDSVLGLQPGEAWQFKAVGFVSMQEDLGGIKLVEAVASE